MIPTPSQSILTEDGEYSFDLIPTGRDVRLEWAFLAGTATVTPGYMDLLGNFSPALQLDGSSPVFGGQGGMCDVGIANSGLAVLKIESAGDLELQVCQTLKPI